MVLHLTINGDRVSSDADPLTPLVDVLREEFYLTGAKTGVPRRLLRRLHGVDRRRR